MNYKLKQSDIIFVKTCIHVLLLYFLVNPFYLAIIDELGGDPVKAITHYTGMGALNLLLITLAISPFAAWSRIKKINKFRRLLGLYAFAYALSHVLCFLLFEVQFDILFFIEEVVLRPYISIGMVAFLIILSLALSSTNYARIKMGNMWQKLHNLIYLAAILVAIHFFWSVKLNVVEPIIYGTVLMILLIIRRRKLGGIRR